MYGEPSVLFWVPVLVLPPGTGGYDVLCVLWIGLDFKPAVTEMAFTAERVNWGGEVVSDLLLLSVVPHAHADVVVACSTPDIEGQFEPNDQDALV